jgi:eukaryotic-like serine/threonine-protein kinase
MPRRDLLPLVQKTLEERYTLERELGRGGAARVFLAHDAAGRKLALKVLHPELKVSVMADRFLREIRLVAQLDHPLIVPIVDSGEKDWLVYFVMPYVEGLTLRQTLDRDRTLSPAFTSQIGVDLLGALACSHQHGIVHRDVKPANVVLSDRGAVLLDFGIARAVVASSRDQLTQSGMTVGTSAYMSPEQVAAEPDLDERSDLYALGCMLFECLAARPPFTNPNENAVLQMHLNEPPPDVRLFRPDTPQALAATIARALRKSRAERWQTASDMQAAILA